MSRRPSLREEQKVLTVNRVLDAAVTVFAEKSVVGAAMDDIAKAAGVTRATVYAHFGGGKSDIIQALVTRAYAALEDSYAQLAAVETWTEAVVRDWLGEIIARSREMAPTIQIVAAAGTGTPYGAANENRQRLRESHLRCHAMLAGDRRRWSGVPEAAAKQRVMMAMLQVEAFLNAWASGRWELDIDDPLDLLTDVVCHLLRPALHG